MTGDKRTQLIQELFQKRKLSGSLVKSKPQGVARAAGKTSPHPKRVRYPQYHKPTGHGFVSCGPLIAREGPAWVKMPDTRETPALRHKRHQGEAALTKIARQLPMKLPRLVLSP